MAYRYLLSHGKHDVVKVKQDKIMIPYASIYKEACREGLVHLARNLLNE